MNFFRSVLNRDKITQYAKKRDGSINKFINRAIKETMERDLDDSNSDSEALQNLDPRNDGKSGERQ